MPAQVVQSTLPVSAQLSTDDLTRKGLDAYEQNDYVAALNSFREAADRGSVTAYVRIGTLYLKGEGVPQNYAQALSWYRKAADQGSADAEYNIGLLYVEGTDPNYSQAVIWFSKAAEHGNERARDSLRRLQQSVPSSPTSK